MARNLKSSLNDTRAATEIVGIILMVTIVIIAATALQLNVNQTAGSKLKIIPIVTMSQRGDQIVIVSIQYGPVRKDDTTIKVFDNSGNLKCYGSIINSDTNISIGDVITIPCNDPGAYTVWMIYQGKQIGTTNYNKY